MVSGELTVVVEVAADRAEHAVLHQRALRPQQLPRTRLYRQRLQLREGLLQALVRVDQLFVGLFDVQVDFLDFLEHGVVGVVLLLGAHEVLLQALGQLEGDLGADGGDVLEEVDRRVVEGLLGDALVQQHLGLEVGRDFLLLVAQFLLGLAAEEGVQGDRVPQLGVPQAVVQELFVEFAEEAEGFGGVGLVDDFDQRGHRHRRKFPRQGLAQPPELGLGAPDFGAGGQQFQVEKDRLAVENSRIDDLGVGDLDEHLALPGDRFGPRLGGDAADVDVVLVLVQLQRFQLVAQLLFGVDQLEVAAEERHHRLQLFLVPAIDGGAVRALRLQEVGEGLGVQALVDDVLDQVLLLLLALLLLVLVNVLLHC